MQQAKAESHAKQWEKMVLSTRSLCMSIVFLNDNVQSSEWAKNKKKLKIL